MVLHELYQLSRVLQFVFLLFQLLSAILRAVHAAQQDLAKPSEALPATGMYVQVHSSWYGRCLPHELHQLSQILRFVFMLAKVLTARVRGFSSHAAQQDLEELSAGATSE